MRQYQQWQQLSTNLKQRLQEYHKKFLFEEETPVRAEVRPYCVPLYGKGPLPEGWGELWYMYVHDTYYFMVLSPPIPLHPSSSFSPIIVIFSFFIPSQGSGRLLMDAHTLSTTRARPPSGKIPGHLWLTRCPSPLAGR